MGGDDRAKSDAFTHRLYYQEADFVVAERVQSLAAERGVSPAQIALAWMVHKEGISAPIIGASKMYQLEEAVAALDIQLSTEEMTHLEEAYQPHPVLGHG